MFAARGGAPAQTPRLDRQSGHTPLTQRMEEVLGSTPRSVSSAVRSPKWHLCTPREGTGRTGETGRTGGKIFAPAPGSSAEIQESPREWIQNIERLRNPDTVASLFIRQRSPGQMWSQYKLVRKMTWSGSNSSE